MPSIKRRLDYQLEQGDVLGISPPPLEGFFVWMLWVLNKMVI